MTSLAGALPAPRRDYEVYSDRREEQPQASSKPTKEVPAYGNRKGYIPRGIDDYGDGGAFPEIHVAQYPLDMGRPGKKSKTTLAVQVDKSGNVRHDAMVAFGKGTRQGKKVDSTFTDLVERRESDLSLVRPSAEEAQATAEKTRLALEKIVNKSIAAAKPVKMPEPEQNRIGRSQYIRYTASEDAPGYNPAAKQRIIRMVEAPVDPMEPAKFRHKKIPGGPPSPPAPVMHSPPRKATVQDQQAWKIPPCVSNWKNAKGYTIALDKRIAADGRSLEQPVINDNFAKMSEALYLAERQARKELELRRAMQIKLAKQEKEKREEELRNLAARARQDRAATLAGRPAPSEQPKSGLVDYASSSSGESEEEVAPSRSRRSASRERRRRARSRSRSYDGGRGRRSPPRGESRQEMEERKEREKLRNERKRERERDMRLAKLGKKTKTMRDGDRDISEKIALGIHRGSGATGVQYDSRLFNQEQGVGSGFGAEDDNLVYSAPWRNQTTTSIYRPRQSESDKYGTTEEQLSKLRDTSRFKPDVDFEGVDRSAPGGRSSGPVAFEKGATDDPFGLDDFTTASSRSGAKAVDKIGARGQMAAAGGSSRDASDMRSNRKMEFTSSRRR